MNAQRPVAPPRKPPPPTPRILVFGFLLNVALGTFFPRLYRRLDWTTRASPRSLALQIAAHAALIMGMDRLLRWFAEGSRVRTEVEARLRKELGRPPWPEELERAWLKARGIDPERAYWLR